MPRMLRQILREAADELVRAGIDTAWLDARLLIAAALERDPHRLAIDPDHPLDAAAFRRIRRLIARRVLREPVSRILGRREFWSLEFCVTPATLDPRPDSETLVEAVLEIAPRDSAITITDLGTGSGCLLLALLSELPNATGIGLDRSRAAITVARRNATRLGLADRARFVQGDWSQRRLAPAAIVIANPPYIPSAALATLEPELAFDPQGALDGGPDGLDAYRAIISRLPVFLSQAGIAAFEIGCEQAAGLARLLTDNGYVVGPPRPDLAGHDRVVVAREDDGSHRPGIVGHGQKKDLE